MRHRSVATRIPLVLALGALLVAGACGAPRKSEPGEGQFPASVEKGAKFLEDAQLELVAMSLPSAPGEVGTFTIRNNTAEIERDLIGTVIYYYDAEPGTFAEFASEAHPTTFDIFKQGEVVLEAKLNAAKPIRSVVVDVERLQGKSTVGRTGKTPGSRFLDGQLECVKIYDRLTADPPRISFAVMNLTRRKVTDLQFRVLLVRGGEIVWKSVDWEWVPGDIEPGKAIAIEPELEGFGLDQAGLPRPVLLIRQEY